jgi:hypothetical protein
MKPLIDDSLRAVYFLKINLTEVFFAGIQLRANLSKFKRFGKDFDINDLDWIDKKRKVRAVTIFFYETSV